MFHAGSLPSCAFRGEWIIEYLAAFSNSMALGRESGLGVSLLSPFGSPYCKLMFVDASFQNGIQHIGYGGIC